jgi:hypothetical protein
VTTDLGELGALETDADAVVDRDPGRESLAEELGVTRTPQLLAVVVRHALPARNPSPSRIPSSCGPNESVTHASNQQIAPALHPVSKTSCSHASRSTSSNPCVRQIASAFAVLPPGTSTTS